MHADGDGVVWICRFTAGATGITHVTMFTYRTFVFCLAEAGHQAQWDSR